MKDIFITIFEDGFLGISLGILIWAIALFIVASIVFGLAYLVNFSFLPEKEGYGKIIGKNFTKAHSETILMYNAALKMSLPQTFYYSDEYSLTIKLDYNDDCIDTVSVSRTSYLSTNYNETVRIKYINGRLWKSFKIKKIFKK